MPEILKIAELGEPILRQEAQTVGNILSESIEALVDNMFATVRSVKGVGLAAPQVFMPIRLFVVDSGPSERYPDAPESDPFAVINPQIISYSDEVEKGWEGCLSIPVIRGIVPRHTHIEVIYTNLSGAEKCEVHTGFIARIIQHEFDHLNGVVFLDRVESTMDIITENQYRKLKE